MTIAVALLSGLRYHQAPLAIVANLSAINMQTQEFRLCTQDDTDLKPEELADFLFLFRGAYATALSYCDLHEIRELDEANCAAVREALKSYASKQDALVLEERFHGDLGPATLRTRGISRNSPWELLLYGVTPAFTLAVILSGGKISLWGLKFEVGPIGEGIKKLREALNLTGTIRASFGVRGVKIKLSKEEYDELRKTDPSQKNKGGFQHFIVSIQNRVSKRTRELELSEGDLERIMRFKSNPKKGGWQSRFKKIFGRHFP